MRTLSIVLCFVCLGCAAAVPPATRMQGQPSTPTLAATPASTSVDGRPGSFLQPVIMAGDDDSCINGMGD